MHGPEHFNAQNGDYGPPPGYYDEDETIVIVADPHEDGYSFSTPDGDYGAHSLEEALSLARSLGYDDVEVER